MPRTYSDTPEPRYVERAKFADNSGEGGVSSYVTITNIYSVEKGFRVVYQVDGKEAEIEIPLEGTDDVIVDVDEANVMINVHLDATTRATIAKALTLPQNAPAETEFVAVGTNNAQKLMTAAESRSALDVKRQLKVTAAEYAAITTKDPNTMYLIVG